MKPDSIKRKLRIVIALLCLVLIAAGLNYALGRFSRLAAEKHARTVRMEKEYFRLIGTEQAAVHAESEFQTLAGDYERLRKNIVALPDPKAHRLLGERISALRVLYDLNRNATDLFAEVHHRLDELFESVRYIHEHHIGYLKNMVRRNILEQDYDTSERLEGSPFKPANEVDIIRMTVAVQTSLFEIFQSFNDLREVGGAEAVRSDFSKKIKSFFFNVNTFEDYSLDAQDGLLVEELLINGRKFEAVFKNLTEIEARRHQLRRQLAANEAEIQGILRSVIQTIETRSRLVENNTAAIQLIVFVFTALTALWMIRGGRQILGDIQKTVRETEKIQQDLSYRIGVEETRFEEFRIVSRALNQTTRQLNEQFGALEASNANLRRENRQRKKTERLLSRAKQMAEGANQAKSDFLANMSHELRTPLNHIIGFTEIVLDGQTGPLTAEQTEFLGDALSSSRHLLSLINDILDLSKVEAGKLELSPSNVPLQPLLENSLVMVKEKALKHGIQFSLDLDPAVGMVTADERKLKQILYNLLSNAVKFTGDGGRVALSARKVGAAGGAENPAGAEPLGAAACSWVEFAVEDSGIGLKAGDLERIFSPFEQAEGAISRQYQGTGLGLSLTRRLVELHGGRIWAESPGAGQGSVFRFRLPECAAAGVVV